MYLPGNNILTLSTVLKIHPEQDFKCQGHYGKAKSQIKVAYSDVSLLTLTNVATKYEYSTPYSFQNIAWTSF